MRTLSSRTVRPSPRDLTNQIDPDLVPLPQPTGPTFTPTDPKSSPTSRTSHSSTNWIASFATITSWFILPGTKPPRNGRSNSMCSTNLETRSTRKSRLLMSSFRAWGDCRGGIGLIFRGWRNFREQRSTPLRTKGRPRTVRERSLLSLDRLVDPISSIIFMILILF